jgi:hypothetical protein
MKNVSALAWLISPLMSPQYIERNRPPVMSMEDALAIVRRQEQ